MTLAYHFTAEKLRDGSPIPAVGEWLFIPEPERSHIKCCQYGLHASLHPFDALQYAPGPYLHLVEMGKILDSETDKIVSDRRQILKSFDATDLLRKFACDQALSVIHLWDAPEIVRQYLETRDESLRATARAAAWDAARDAARDVALAVARAAALAAARAAAWDAARDVAWDTALAAARTVARAAARDVAWDTARDAAWDAARAAAWATAWDTALAAAKVSFKKLVDEAFANIK